MPTVLVPTAYRGPTRGLAEVVVVGATVRECLEAVEAHDHEADEDQGSAAFQDGKVVLL